MPSPVVLLRLPVLGSSVLVVPLDCERLLGRSTGCDFVIDHPSVSRRHALLSVNGSGLGVTDLASRNGTFVDDVRVVGKAVAALGSRIRFGSLEFLTAGYNDGAEELDSTEETDNPPPSGQPRARKDGYEQLSVAQQRVFHLLVEGLSEKRIASRLKISPCTVHNHITAIYWAFQVHSRAELLVCALSGNAAT